MKIPPLHRMVFTAFITCAWIFPISFFVTKAFPFYGAVSDSIMKGLLPPFFIGLLGLTVWMMIYLQREPKMTRLGLATILAVTLLFALSLATIKG